MQTYRFRRATQLDNAQRHFKAASSSSFYLVFHTAQDPYIVVGAARIEVGASPVGVYVWSATKAPTAIRSLRQSASRAARMMGYRSIKLYDGDALVGVFSARGSRMYPTPPLDTAHVGRV